RGGGRGEPSGAAVGGRPPHRLGADIGAGPRPVLDHELLAEPLGEPLTHHARDEVGVAGRRERHDHPHRPRRIGLRPGDARGGRHRRAAPRPPPHYPPPEPPPPPPPPHPP